jgi:hypothetical protein
LDVPDEPAFAADAVYRDGRVGAIAAEVVYRPTDCTLDSDDWRTEVTAELVSGAVAAV